jgi:predicted Zn-ribbon and HTH transcriptional regulator
MEESKKKPIMIAVIVVCLVVAGIITFAKRSGGGGGYESIPEGKMTWVKCNNPDCKAEYQMEEREYFKAMKERLNPAAMMSTVALICEKCGKASLGKAHKCGNPSCGAVFFDNSVPNDHPDRCPKCKRSEIEEIRKARKAAGQ